MIYSNILEAVGNTPMVELQRMPEPGSARVLVKVEGLNVGGSIKTRTALNMIEQAEKEGIIGPDTIMETRESAWLWSERSRDIARLSSCLTRSARSAQSLCAITARKSA